MKKLLTIITISMFAAVLAGCTETGNTSSVPPTAESKIESSVKEEKSNDEDSKKEESKKDDSKNEKSNDEDSEKDDSKEEKSNDEDSKEEKSNDEDSEEDSENENSDSKDSENEESDGEASEESKKEDDIFSFKIRLNDIEYQLPFDYDELAQLGYYFDKDGELEPEKYTLGVNPKNDNGDTIKAQLWNPTDKVLDYSECKIGSLEIKLGDEINVVLPGEFVFDDSVTPESVKEQYGEPESEHISEKYVTLRYKKDFQRIIEFFIYTDESMIDYTSVTIKNFS